MVCSGNIVILWAYADTIRAAACWFGKQPFGCEKASGFWRYVLEDGVIITFSFGTGNADAVTI
ncbi:MAG: hypothetical protein J1E35_05215 [Lachnospiraceae bacterium]|nr:hypothetical protein [Lachnospiraceae bacterium]